MKIIKTATLALALSASFSASAYEPKYLTDEFYSNGMINAIVQNMDYNAGSRAETHKKRMDLIACMVDTTASEVKEAGIEPPQADGYIASAVLDLYKYYRTTEYARDTTMDPQILNWVPELENKCIEYHPDPRKNIQELSVRLGNQDYESGMCESGDLTCFQERVQYHRTRLSEEIE